MSKRKPTGPPRERPAPKPLVPNIHVESIPPIPLVEPVKTAPAVANPLNLPMYVTHTVNDVNDFKKQDKAMNDLYGAGYEYLETLIVPGNVVALRFRLRG